VERSGLLRQSTAQAPISQRVRASAATAHRGFVHPPPAPWQAVHDWFSGGLHLRQVLGCASRTWHKAFLETQPTTQQVVAESCSMGSGPIRASGPTPHSCFHFPLRRQQPRFHRCFDWPNIAVAAACRGWLAAVSPRAGGHQHLGHLERLEDCSRPDGTSSSLRVAQGWREQACSIIGRAPLAEATPGFSGAKRAWLGAL